MVVGFPAFPRAPGRGRYERRRTGAERFLAQRRRLLRATAIAHLEGDASVTRVTSLSGVGRTTFYECFDDFGHALSAVRGDVAQRVRRALSLRSEHPDLAELCSVWLRVAIDEPLSMLAALEPQSGAEPEVLTLFQEAVSRSFPAARMQGAALMHAVACAQASARSTALSALGAPPEFSGAMGAGDAGAPGALAIESLTRSIRCLLADKL